MSTPANGEYVCYCNKVTEIDIEKAIAESLYAEKVAWYEAQVKRIESRTLAEGLRLFKGAVPDEMDESLLPRGASHENPERTGSYQ